MASSPLDQQETRAVARALRILERCLHDPSVNAFTSTDITRSYFRCRMAALEREEFHGCWLNSQHRLLAIETLFTGTITQASIYPREVVKSALRHNAAAAIIAHNHPGGSSEPSAADIALTKELKIALQLVGVTLLDHIIVGATSTTSLFERGLL